MKNNETLEVATMVALITACSEFFGGISNGDLGCLFLGTFFLSSLVAIQIYEIVYEN